MDLSKIDAMEEIMEQASSEEATDEVATDDASSSSASSEESAEQDEDEGGSDIADADRPLPFRTRENGPIHLQNFLSPAGAVPYCRDTPYTGFVQEERGAWDETCLKCKQRLPKGIACKLRLSGGVG